MKTVQLHLIFKVSLRQKHTVISRNRSNFFYFKKCLEKF